jgi:hypothetical protein
MQTAASIEGGLEVVQQPSLSVVIGAASQFLSLCNVILAHMVLYSEFGAISHRQTHVHALLAVTQGPDAPASCCFQPPCC